MEYDVAKWWLKQSKKQDFQDTYILTNNQTVKDIIWKAKLTVGLNESELKEVKD